MRVMKLMMGGDLRSLAVGLSGCISMPKMAARPGFTATQCECAASSAASDTYDGLGGAVQAPMRDLNLIHDDVPPILVRAYARPYDMTGLDTCDGISEQVRQLDLALGPGRGHSARGDHGGERICSPRARRWPPMRRSTRCARPPPASFQCEAGCGAFRAPTGPSRRPRRWRCPGSVRRGYLKAIGQAKGCEWPASPLRAHVFKANVDADPAMPHCRSWRPQCARRWPPAQLPPPEPVSAPKPQN